MIPAGRCPFRASERSFDERDGKNGNQHPLRHYRQQRNVGSDGRSVAFDSNADLDGDPARSQDVFVHDRQTGTTTRVSVDSNGIQGNSYSGSIGWSSISADGRYVVFSSYASNLVPNDTNGRTDVFVWSRATGTIERVSIATGGAEGNGSAWDPVMSQDGRFVSFTSDSGTLVPNDNNGVWDVFLRDRLAALWRRK